LTHAGEFDENGNDWNQWNKSAKLYYVSGFVNGVNTAVIGATGSDLTAHKEPSKRLAAYLIDGVTLGQMIDGIDLLYGDFMNRNIYLFDAFFIVRDQIKGTPPEDIDRILLWLRSGRKNNDSLLVKDEKGNIIKTISFP
jgi:hypothetical protein